MPFQGAAHTFCLGEESEVVDRNVDVHIRGVRKQLGKAASAIETIRGVGYRCDPNYTETLESELH